jgi:hypothetical protein
MKLGILAMRAESVSVFIPNISSDPHFSFELRSFSVKRSVHSRITADSMNKKSLPRTWGPRQASSIIGAWAAFTRSISG